MAATASEALQERIESARNLDLELRRCQSELEGLRSSLLARPGPEDIRRQFRHARDAMMCLGRSLSLDSRFRPRLLSNIREQALGLLRAGAKPIEVQRQLGIDNLTVRRLRHRDLGDNRDLRKIRRLTDAQIAEIRAAGYGTHRKMFAKKFGVSMSLISKVRNGRASYREVTKVPPSIAAPRDQRSVRQENVGQPKTGELRRKFSRPLMQSLMEMAELASPKRPGITEIQSYVIGLVEAQIAEFRCRRIPADFLCRNDKTPILEVGDNIKPRGKLSLDEKKRIIEQRGAGVSIPVLAERWHCGASSIRRALQGAKKRGPTPEKVQQILFHAGHNNDEFLGVQKIAEAVGESEKVVRSILANHHPLTPSSSTIHGRPPRPGGWQRNMVAG